MYKVVKIRLGVFQVVHTDTKEIVGAYTTVRFATSVAYVKNIQSKA